jgi:thiamine biosynthesis protein ThiS
MITLMVNGKEKIIESMMDIPFFLKTNGIDSQYVAVAHNGIVLEREEFSTAMLKDGDTLEIVRPVGGG